MSVLSVADAIDLVAAIFGKYGCSSDNARSVARALVAAEADGLRGHGFSRIPTYLEMVKSGKIDGKATPRETRPRPGVLAIDAACGFAYPAIDLALTQLPNIASTQGIGIAAISRSNHCGAAGLPCEALARQGLVSLLFANTPSAMAPWGAEHPVFGTIRSHSRRQPGESILSWWILRCRRSHAVRSLRQSNVAESIPEGWALDTDGNPTTDPAAALAGTMIPLGDAKGAALAFMVEILAACLTGSNPAFEASSFLDGEGGPPKTGQLILAIDPAAFGHQIFLDRVAALVGAIESQDGARLPGSRRLAIRSRAAREGLAIPPEIKALADN